MGSAPPNDTLSWYVFDDRQMYRPSEEIHVKGWLRRIGGRQDGDVGLVGPGSEFCQLSNHRSIRQCPRQWAGGCEYAGRL